MTNTHAFSQNYWLFLMHCLQSCIEDPQEPSHRREAVHVPPVSGEFLIEGQSGAAHGWAALTGGALQV